MSIVKEPKTYIVALSFPQREWVSWSSKPTRVQGIKMTSKYSYKPIVYGTSRARLIIYDKSCGVGMKAKSET